MDYVSVCEALSNVCQADFLIKFVTTFSIGGL